MDYKIAKRVELLETMNNVMININDENYYLAWIYIYPDGATNEDNLEIASDDETFTEVLEHYAGIISHAIEHNAL